MSDNFEWHPEKRATKIKTESGTEFFLWGDDLTSELEPRTIREVMLLNYPSDLTESDIVTLIGRIHYLEDELEILNIQYKEVIQKKTKEQERDYQEDIESIKKPTETISKENTIDNLTKTNEKLVDKFIDLTEKYYKLVKEHQILERETNEKISSLEERINILIESKLSVSKAPSRWIDEIISDLEEENID